MSTWVPKTHAKRRLDKEARSKRLSFSHQKKGTQALQARVKIGQRSYCSTEKPPNYAPLSYHESRKPWVLQCSSRRYFPDHSHDRVEHFADHREKRKTNAACHSNLDHPRNTTSKKSFRSFILHHLHEAIHCS